MLVTAKVFFSFINLSQSEKRKNITVKAGCQVCKEYVVKAQATVSGMKDIVGGDQKGMCAAHMIKANNGFNTYQKSAQKSIHPGKDTARLTHCFRPIHKAKLINICFQNDTA